MTDKMITYEVEGDIAVIGLDRAAKRNAINDELLKQLREACFRATEETKAAVIFGHGDNFSAGLDLAEAATWMKPGAPRKRRGRWHRPFDLIGRGPIPFVAGGGAVRIQRLMGYARMADLMLTGRVLTAQEGDRANLCQYVVPKGESLERAKSLASRIAKNAPLTNFYICNGLPRVNDLSHDDGLFMEALISNAVASPEGYERIKAFVEKQAAPLVEPGKSGDGR